MAEVLRCTDRWGREIVLMDSQWVRHIHENHPAMIGQLGAIQAAIENAEIVNHDQRHPNGESFYRLGGLPAPLDRSYVKVCVRFTLLAPNGPWRGEIVTAYPTTTIKAGEVQRWP